MNEIEYLRQRLAAAERVCYLVGITGVDTSSDRDKAKTQAWMEWAHAYGPYGQTLSEADVLTLAARRDVIRNNTITRLRQNERQRLIEECQGTALEALYERQHEPEAYAAHRWSDWRVVPGQPDFKVRSCDDGACGRVQTRRVGGE